MDELELRKILLKNNPRFLRNPHDNSLTMRYDGKIDGKIKQYDVKVPYRIKKYWEEDWGLRFD